MKLRYNGPHQAKGEYEVSDEQAQKLLRLPGWHTGELDTEPVKISKPSGKVSSPKSKVEG